MIRQICLSAGAAAAIALAGASPIHAHGNKHGAGFEHVGTFIACENTSCDRNSVGETVAEITTVSKDGRTLIYTDSPQNVIGFVDIANPSKPKALGVVHVGGASPPSSATIRAVRTHASRRYSCSRSPDSRRSRRAARSPSSPSTKNWTFCPNSKSYNGWVLDKVEGLTAAADGKVYALTDNDGVDGASGETRLLRLGRSLH